MLAAVSWVCSPRGLGPGRMDKMLPSQDGPSWHHPCKSQHEAHFNSSRHFQVKIFCPHTCISNSFPSATAWLLSPSGSLLPVTISLLHREAAVWKGSSCPWCLEGAGAEPTSSADAWQHLWKLPFPTLSEEVFPADISMCWSSGRSNLHLGYFPSCHVNVAGRPPHPTSCMNMA